ncbi:MAG: hypothetical protein ABI411_11780 [Tahibacter sp.]
MRLSISSSNRRWLLIGVVTMLLGAAIATGVEFGWRSQGYVPNVIDSMQLWSQQRDRVYATDKTPLVMLGASRIEFGVDMPRMRALLPGHEPVMLALNGRYPLAALEDLANDADFHGTVICDLEPNGMLREFRSMQRPYVDYYHRQWTPNWRLHRTILTVWQRSSLIADPRFGLIASLRHALDGGKPFRDYIRFHADRSGDIDYQLTDPEAAKRHFEATVEGNIKGLPQRSAEEWFSDIQPIFAWIRQIQARGGQVILYQSPLHGLQRQVMQRLYPDGPYWDRIAAASPGPVLDGNRIDSLAVFSLPDDSHLDFRDKPAYTEALVEVLLAHHVFDNPAPVLSHDRLTAR